MNNNPNEHIITILSEAIQKHCGEDSPEVAKIKSLSLIGDQRILGNHIIKLFPWPIGVGIRKLFAIPEKNEQRLTQLLRISEVSIQFFSYILLAQLWEEKKLRQINLSADFKDQLGKLERPSFGVTAGLIRAINNIFEQNKIQAFTHHLESAFFSAKNFDHIVFKLVNIRNDEEHYNKMARYNEVEDLALKVLSYLSFLAMYKLVSVSDIRVLKNRNMPAKFKHVMRLLNNTHDDFDIESHDYNEFSESYSVFLLKEFTLPKQYLNLSPFLIDAQNIIQLDRNEAAKEGIKNGIYLFGGIQNTNVNYYLVNGNEKASINNLSTFSQIETEFEDLKNTLEYEKSI